MLVDDAPSSGAGSGERGGGGWYLTVVMRRVGLCFVVLIGCRGPAPGPALDGALADAAADAPLTDAATDAPLTDAATDAAADGPTDAAVDASPDAGIPFTSPRIDQAYGLRCTDSRRALGMAAWVLADGSIFSCRGYSVNNTFRKSYAHVCRPDGTQASGPEADELWQCFGLSDGRMVMHHTHVADVYVAQPSPMQVGSIPGDLQNLLDVDGSIYVLRPELTRYDGVTLAPISTSPALPLPNSWVWRCGSPTRVLGALDGNQLVRIDPLTWTIDPSYPAVPLSAPPWTATARVLVRRDCTAVLVVKVAAGVRFDVYDPAGALARSFTLALPLPGTMIFDHQGRLLLDFEGPQPIDLRLARVDVTAGRLDPSFGVGGLAELAIPGVDTTPMASPTANLLAVAPDASLVAVVWSATGMYRSTQYVRVLVDD